VLFVLMLGKGSWTAQALFTADVARHVVFVILVPMCVKGRFTAETPPAAHVASIGVFLYVFAKGTRRLLLCNVSSISLSCFPTVTASEPTP